MLRLLLLVVLIVGPLGYWYWTTTPQYSVLQLRKSIKEHDLNSFRKYADVDTVASRMVDDLLTKPVQRALGPGIVGELLGFGLGVFVKPLLVDSMKHKITDYVEGRASTASIENEIRTASAGGFSSIPGQLGFTGKVFKDIEYVRTEGKIALIGIKLFNAKYNEDMILELKLRDAGGYWQLMELSNLQPFMGRILELQMGSSTQTESMLSPKLVPAEAISLRAFPIDLFGLI